MDTVRKLKDNWKAARRFCREKKTALIVAAAALGILGITVLVILNRHCYTAVSVVKDYTEQESDNYSYIGFADGVIRYSRDGIVYLNQDNEEVWNQSAQLQNPCVTMGKDVLVVSDSGSNEVMIFSKEGLKGEFSTVLPIERTAVSEQGIVAAILKNESTPKIMVYDIKGNVLAEIQSTAQGKGYPVALALSEDANLLAVSFFSTEGTKIKSNVVYYNFGTVGQSKKDNLVNELECEDELIPTIFFADEDTSVLIGDSAFRICEGKQIPELKEKIELDKEIKSVFYSEEYVGFVLRNTGKKGYELRVYNMTGKQQMLADFQGDYGNVKLSGDEIIMLEGDRGCIYTVRGTLRFRGELGMDTTEMIPVSGRNRYMLFHSNVIQKVRLSE